MNRKKSGFLAAGLLLASTLAASPSLLAQSKANDAGMPKVGDVAPDFTLKYINSSGDEKEVKLSDYRGKKNVVVAFYIFAFTGG